MSKSKEITAEDIKELNSATKGHCSGCPECTEADCEIYECDCCGETIYEHS